MRGSPSRDYWDLEGVEVQGISSNRVISSPGKVKG